MLRRVGELLIERDALAAKAEAGKELYGLAEYVRAYLSTGHDEDDQRENWRLRLLRQIDDERARWEAANAE